MHIVEKLKNTTKLSKKKKKKKQQKTFQSYQLS